MDFIDAGLLILLGNLLYFIVEVWRATERNTKELKNIRSQIAALNDSVLSSRYQITKLRENFERHPPALPQD